MNKFISQIVLCCTALMLSATVGVAQAQTTEQIIKQLEDSGALDKAVEKAILRIKQKELAAQRAQEEQVREIKAQKAKNARSVDASRDFIFGKPDAVISIIEYSDFECPYCKHFHEIPKALVAEMPDQVNLVWRNYPLPFHDPMATKEASAAVCAYQQGGNNAFWKYGDAIMKATRSNGEGMPAENEQNPMLSLASAQGLNAVKLWECMISDDTKKQIVAEMENAKTAGISGTPGVILINHSTGTVQVLPGAVPYSVVKEAIQKLLTK